MLLACLSLSVTGICQLNKGVWLAGGTGTFYKNKAQFVTPNASVSSDKFDIEVQARVGNFVADKLAIGLNPGFSWWYYKGANSESVVTNQKNYFIGPFCRYYFLEKDRPNNLVFDVSYQHGFQRFGGPVGTLRKFSALAGPVIFFNSSVAMEFLFGYAHQTSIEKRTGVSTHTIKGVQLSVGFQIHLEKE